MLISRNKDTIGFTSQTTDERSIKMATTARQWASCPDEFVSMFRDNEREETLDVLQTETPHVEQRWSAGLEVVGDELHRHDDTGKL